MASVALQSVFFNVAADPADRISLRTVSEFSRAPGVPGRVVRGAGGRVRLIRRAGSSVEWSLAFGAVTREEGAWLEGRAGELVCFRTPGGHKMFGVYTSVDLSEWMRGGLAAASLTVTELTFSEAV